MKIVEKKNKFIFFLNVFLTKYLLNFNIFYGINRIEKQKFRRKESGKDV